MYQYFRYHLYFPQIQTHVPTYIWNKEIITSYVLWVIYHYHFDCYTYIQNIQQKLYVFGTKSMSQIVTTSLRPTGLLVVEAQGQWLGTTPLGSPSSDSYGLRELFFDRNPFFQNQINEHLHMVIIVFLSNWINRPSSGFFVVGSTKSEIINLYSILHHKQCNFQWKC